MTVRPHLAFTFAFALLSSGAARAADGASSLTLRSPNGQLAIQFSLIVAAKDSKEATQLAYSITFHGKPVMEPSRLGLELQGQRPLGNNVRIVTSAPSNADQSYELVTGKTKSVRDHYNALRLDVEDRSPQKRKLAVEARAYDDAVAFRYLLPDQLTLRNVRLTNESTQFRLSQDAITWALVLPNFRSMYESEFLKLPISAFANQGGVASKALIGLPLLMNLPGTGWLAITEANLRDYSSLYLVNEAGGWSGHGFEARLAPSGDEPEVAVVGALPHYSAWRVFLVGDQPGTLMESNVITSLNPPSAIKDTSWIRAGRSSWDWWNGSTNAQGESAFTTETMKYYVDFAAKSHFEYMLIDAGWSAPTDITKMNGKVDVPEVVRYAKPKNVKVWIWLPYTLTDAQMEEAFPLYEQWGVAGLKIDFIERDDQRGISFYYRTADLAARHHLMVDFHGATKPTGLERTYPNVLGYEAVLGMEQSKGGRRDNPENHVTLPFTRMLAGRMDYTPGGFDNVTPEQFVPRGAKRPMVMGTRAHHLAMYAIYESPFQMVSDTPKAYEDQPSFEFIKAIPATWDETKVINGEPGEYVTVARKHGNQWFLGAMTNWTPRQLDIALSFLGPGNWTAETYEDASDSGESPKTIQIQKRRVDASTHLTLKLARGGGAAIRFVPGP